MTETRVLTRWEEEALFSTDQNGMFCWALGEEDRLAVLIRDGFLQLDERGAHVLTDLGRSIISPKTRH